MADFKIQRGGVTIGDGATSVTITSGTEYTAPASKASSFIRIVSSMHAGDGTDGNFSGQPDRNFVSISNPGNLLTSIAFTRFSSTTAVQLKWEIIEYTGTSGGDNEFIVRGQEVLTTTALTHASSAISGIATTADVVPFITSASTPIASTSRHAAEHITCTAEISAGVCTITRRDASINATFSLEYVEFVGANWDIQKVAHSYTAEGDETETITSVDLTKTFIHQQFRVDTAADAGAFSPEVRLTAATTLTHTLQSSFTDADSLTYIIENTQATGVIAIAARYSGDRTNDAGTAPRSWAEAITPVISLDNTIVTISASTDKGNDTSNAFIGAQLTDLDEVTLYQGDNNERIDYTIEVFEWPSESSSASLAIDTAPTSIVNGVANSFTISGPATTPTTANTTVGIGSVDITPSSITGSDPYVVNFTAPTSFANKFNSTGFTWTVTVVAETVTSGTIPYLEAVGKDFVDCVFGSIDVASTISVYHGDTASTLENAQYVYDSVTSPSSITITAISDDGYVTLASTPAETQTFNGYVIESDGTIRTSKVYTISLAKSATREAADRVGALQGLIDRIEILEAGA
jgi:hypothetical protein